MRAVHTRALLDAHAYEDSSERRQHPDRRAATRARLEALRTACTPARTPRAPSSFPT